MKINYLLLLCIGLVQFSCVSKSEYNELASNNIKLKDQLNFYIDSSKEAIALAAEKGELLKNLRDSLWLVSRATRIPINKLREVKKQAKDFKKWKDALNFPPSQDSVIIIESYAFELSKVISLYEDIKYMNQVKADAVTGIRLHMYLKKDDKFKNTAFTDCFITPIDKNGHSIYEWYSKVQAKDIAIGSTSLYTSLLCPDACPE